MNETQLFDRLDAAQEAWQERIAPYQAAFIQGQIGPAELIEAARHTTRDFYDPIAEPARRAFEVANRSRRLEL